ncbi:MAG: sulfite exporter TauE/SafE family protein [Alphaproteobacteria bacterium]|nr:sulfite exporter TauE/SafE family protein [Alphaproteobacteria bacterium]NCQ66959.1 sulfite exporter TauE/SafE family protein [Alphaproteobacteria bacterium]NCT07525.1 sulfite exporter TauE/SafE family protein [Alphaproteobacteria bacterium]
MIDIAGYILAAFMGLTLGMIGGGGSILTVPIFVYVLSINPVKSTSYSLLVVGAAALFGALRYHFENLVNYRAAAIFGLPSLVSVYLTRRYLMPALPEEILVINGFLITKAIFIMVLFASLMVTTAYFMIRSNGKPTPPRNPHLTLRNLLIVAVEGSMVGIVTGIVGAGGGFLIVPALVLLVGLSMKEAVATSLLIIALKSLAGVIGDLQAHVTFDWVLLGYFLGFTLGGMFLGTHLAHRVSDGKLKKTFGWFVLILGVMMLCGQISQI